jgi:hypothetical protein
VSACDGLPEEDPDGPDVRGPARLLASKPLGRDVRERPRNVTDSCERVGVLELGKAEVEQPDGDLVAVLQHDVGRLHVTVDDALAVGVGERLQHLRGRLDRRPVVERPATKGLPERVAGDVRIGDVDVTIVP